MGIDRYVSSDFVTGQAVSSGLIGNLYGVDIYVSNNCATMKLLQTTLLDLLILVLFSCSTAIVILNSLPYVQTQYKQEYLSTLYTADCLYGVQVYRPEAGFVLAVAE